MDRRLYSNNAVYYMQARFYRKEGSGEHVYCIEPFIGLDPNTPYESTITPSNLTNEQIDRIGKIAYFGYGYKNHTDSKWFAITQLMIWQVADSSGEYYFTSGLNGPRNNAYQEEQNEINYLIDQYNKIPSFTGKAFYIVEGNSITITDENNILNQFRIYDNRFKINNNTLETSELKAGMYSLSLVKDQEKRTNKPLIFYISNSSQNLVETGDPEKIVAKFKIIVKNTYLELSKVDKDTNNSSPSGEGSLDGAIYTLYDENKNKIQDLVIEENHATLKNLNFGKYYLKETTSGEGYTLDENEYEININENTPRILLVVKNEIIKKKIIIEKKYGEDNNLKGEEGITFEIENNKGDILSLTTDENGYIETILPYGTYQVKQINTTEGYEKIKDFTIEVKNQEEERIILQDLKIAVPDTYTNGNHKLFYILLWILCTLI